MAENKDPYINRNHGDLIIAEDWNSLQVQIKEDICNKVEAAKEEIREGSVKQAENAEKFANESDEEWVNKLDERYALENHSHEGQSVYRRYIKVFDSTVNEVFLEHQLGRYPLVDVYELLPVIGENPKGDVIGFEDCKLLVYYGQKDAQDFDLWLKVYRDKKMLGIPLEQFLNELGVGYENDVILEDVINDMCRELMKDPNDEIKVCLTPWIEDKCNKKRTVYELDKAGQWSDMSIAIKPRKCGKGADLNLVEGGTVQEPTCLSEVTHVNYDCLHIQSHGLSGDEKLCCMFLLRI